MSLRVDGNSLPVPVRACLGCAHTTSHKSCSSSPMPEALRVCAYHTYMCTPTNMHMCGSLPVFPL